MFHMLTCFNLSPATTIREFQQSLDEFSKHLQEIDLVHSTGSIGRRNKHEIMDTDDERDHEFFFTMTFRDQAQCDLAVEYIKPHKEPAETSHNSVLTKVVDAVFICWEDI